MRAPPIAILDAGMVTGVGLTAAASSAAIRCAIDNFQETRFEGDGDWLLGSEVPLEHPVRGRPKLVEMLAMAIGECLDRLPADAVPEEIPLVLNLAEQDRPGRLGPGNTLHEELMAKLGVRFHTDSRVLSDGRVGGVIALHIARRLLHRENEPPHYVIVAGVDSLLVGPTLAAYLRRDRILTAKNSDGFIPGEAGGAFVVSRLNRARKDALICLGLGFAKESATIESEEPLRAKGLSDAIKAALAEAGCELGDLDFRLTDVSGEQYGFKEAALALGRVLRKRKEEFDIWHPADCIGEIGAAALPCMLGVALSGQRDGYAPGPGMICHLGNDDGKRAALVLRPAVEHA